MLAILQLVRRIGNAGDFESGLGSLDRVKRVIKLLGMVNCDADFENHPAVINGCSELFAKVFGEDSRWSPECDRNVLLPEISLWRSKAFLKLNKR